MAVGYSGDILQARDRAAEAANNVNVAYSIPKEGALMWLDSFAIPADAPHPDEAHAFINFMLRPEIAARNSNFVFYANGNLASQAAARRGGAQRPGDLSGRGDAREALHDDAERSARAARDDAHLDGGEDGAVGLRVARMERSEIRDAPSPALRSAPCGLR